MRNISAIAAALATLLPTNCLLSLAFASSSIIGKPPHHLARPNACLIVSSARPLVQLSAQQGGIEVGIQTAQLLMDPRRHDKLKLNIQRRWPLVPDAFLDPCIDLCADAFKNVAPDKLKLALKPGGMEKVRPDIERSIVNVAMEQKMVRDIPVLNDADKSKMLEAIVDLALDSILDDAEEILAAPEVRLETLEREMREVKQLMGPWRLILYRVRNNPLPVSIALALSVTCIYVKRDDPLVAPVLHIGKVILSEAATAIAALYRFLHSGLMTLMSKMPV
mmetsp:Transcript_21034/g.45856  ORF Transcript_21034/g.45856 Transcript_21034/m.45856 type:complete len:278 (-) Transcript_21034:1319-2152(-)|eukprot:CAMPEP_0178482580 /NCGR_PEP_ID=MMETSP0696-20121128/6799_1 /TAXON_ID=265572 /ORGANISM="Extubocellulus spinifer, Strain CCMP396" /LENGTH=277 /DNA_ID=CAMNT_0020110085 /DNA_START=154 /DNA_END=987 /DNA_ORIENTATION=+